MYHFRYVSRNELSPIKNDLIKLINEVQNQLRTDFTFQFRFVGSCEHNMVTYDPKTNIGYDFDVNFEINSCHLSPEEIRRKVFNALTKVFRNHGYNDIKNSTRVIKIKCIDKKNSKILRSCDFAIVHNYFDDDEYECQEYIHFDKARKCYIWEEQPDEYYKLLEKIEWIKNGAYHNELRVLYLNKKNNNSNPNKRSHSLYAEAVHEICQRYGYYDSSQIH